MNDRKSQRHPLIRNSHFVLLAGLIGFICMEDAELLGQTPYKQPPKEIQAILNAPPAPSVSVSPTRDRLLLLHSERYPPIADLAAPMLRLAGYRIDPKSNGPHRRPRVTGLSLMTIANGKSFDINLPPRARVSNLRWSPTGNQFAFTNTTDKGLGLWIGNIRNGGIGRIPGMYINAAYGVPLQWMPDGKSLLCQIVPKQRGKPPMESTIPAGPRVLESKGKDAPVRTYQDLLRDEHDKDLFDYYAASQLVLVDSGKATVRNVGKPAVIRSAAPSPDGKYILVTRNKRPYSLLLTASYFPQEIEVWNLRGRRVHTVASLPLAEEIPIEGVRTGPRWVHWQPTGPATLIWAEALDGGDPRRKVKHRDRLMAQAAPFEAKPAEWHKTKQRYFGLTWAEDGWAFVRDYDRDKRWRRTFLVNCSAGKAKTKVREIWSHSVHERYKNPGGLVMRTLPNGYRIVRQHEGNVFLIGAGASPDGDRPFLDKMNLTTLETKRLFHCAKKTYELPIAFLADDGSRFLTRYESPTDPPNCYVHELGKKRKTALTDFADPAPQLRRIKKELVTYKRSDGVPLSFTLYLPPGYRKGRRLPAVVWAYPREYVDASTAGQVSGSPYRFTTIGGPSHLFFLLRGYAVLDGATMPVIGNPQKANNTFVNQIVSSAKAAIDKADEMGVIDRNRVGLGGHSYGAFMTANLLAHSDLFRAGIARSGAYNRTLTPFGFQNERRTLWEAPEIYFKVSPFLHAAKINEPLLLLHGEVDNNSGTFPLQSERMYHAVKGTKGTVRLVMLPHESHGYRARESVEHALYEMFEWFDRYVKND